MELFGVVTEDEEVDGEEEEDEDKEEKEEFVVTPVTADIEILWACAVRRRVATISIKFCE